MVCSLVLVARVVGDNLEPIALGWMLCLARPLPRGSPSSWESPSLLSDPCGCSGTGLGVFLPDVSTVYVLYRGWGACDLEMRVPLRFVDPRMGVFSLWKNFLYGESWRCRISPSSTLVVSPLENLDHPRDFSNSWCSLSSSFHLLVKICFLKFSRYILPV